MLARDAPTMTDPNLDAKAKAYFTAMFSRPEATDIVVNATFSTTSGTQVLVTGSAKVKTTIMQIAGYSTMTINGESTAKWGSERLRVALALDVTGSMASAGKMTALKSATKGLLSQLKGAASTSDAVHVSIVPFNKNVNLGASNNAALWLDWSLFDASNSGSEGMSGSICWSGTLYNIDNDGWHNVGSCSKNGGSLCYNGTLWKFNGNWYTAGFCTHMTWNGCVTDRGDKNKPSSADYDRKVTAPSTSILASLFPAEQYGSCPEPIMGLTNNWDALNGLVDKLEPDGMTNQPIGLVWAWQSLVGGGPLTAPAKTSGYNYKEIIVLMSDGLNTQNRWTSKADSETDKQKKIDKRMYDGAGVGTCENAKATGITIYTVHVNTDGDPKSTLLENCASGTDKFWMITSAGDLTTVFNKIATEITKLRVAK